MARDGSGNYALAAGNPVADGDYITAAWANSTLNDIAAALTTSLCADGQTSPSANLPMNGHKHTGVADASAATEYMAYGQMIKQGATVYRTSSFTRAAGATAISWQAQTGDTVSSWAIGNPTRLVVPAGYSKARLTACIDFSVVASTGYITFYMSKNVATDFLGMGIRRMQVNSASNGGGVITSSWVPVASPDYFEIWLQNGTTATQTFAADATERLRLWASIEFMK